MTNKYELITSDTKKDIFDKTVYRIRALEQIGLIAAGTLGGYVQSTDNLSLDHLGAWVSGNATVSGNARVFGDATVLGNATKTPIVIQGDLPWTVTITDYHIRIGCQFYTIADWEKFDDKTIRAMGYHALSFWRGHKSAIFNIIKASGRSA